MGYRGLADTLRAMEWDAADPEWSRGTFARFAQYAGAELTSPWTCRRANGHEFRVLGTVQTQMHDWYLYDSAGRLIVNFTGCLRAAGREVLQDVGSAGL